MERLNAGIAFVLKADCGFDRCFVIFGLAGLALSSVFGGLFTLPRHSGAARGRGPNAATTHPKLVSCRRRAGG